MPHHDEHGMIPSGAWWKAERKPLPSLPPELWGRIIRWSTLVPGALAIEPRDPFEIPHTRLPRKHEHDALRHALVTKRYVVRVCKTWHALATPFLYEALLVGRGRVLKSLAETLARSRRNTEERDEEGPAFGWWTKRLDVRIREAGPEGFAELGHLADIAECLPNLCILELGTSEGIYGTLDLPRSVVQALAKTCGPSLRVIHADSAVLSPDIPDWPLLLRSASDLRDLSGTGTAPLLVLEGMAPRLEALTCDWSFPPETVMTRLPRNQASGTLRELRYLIPPSWRKEVLTEFFEIFGQSLERLYIKTQEPLQLRIAGRYAPRLSHLVVDAFNIVEIKCIPPSVTHLGLQFEYRPKPSRSEFRRLFGSFANMEAASLRIIRVLHGITVDILRRNQAKVLEDVRGVVRGRGWRLEDDEGKEL